MSKHNSRNNTNTVYLYPKGCITGLHPYTQEEILESVISFTPRLSRHISSLFKNSDIRIRHSIFENLFHGLETDSVFKNISKLDTTKRNNLYREYAPLMFKRAAENILNDLKNISPKSITHIITASCTGCYSPGPGDQLIKTLELNSTTQRTHIGYMGCYAGLAAIRLANSICLADPKAIVLVVCVEISSLHWHEGCDYDNQLSLSLFADGSAAAIISSEKLNKSFMIHQVGSDLIPESDTEMAWNMGELGFEMRISRDVPKIIGDHLESLITNFTKPFNLDISEIDFWAIHPGGSKILKFIEKNLVIDKSQMLASWETLRDFGNMSSTTIFFVLENILLHSENNNKIFSMAFGPGLTVEKLLLTTNE